MGFGLHIGWAIEVFSQSIMNDNQGAIGSFYKIDASIFF